MAGKMAILPSCHESAECFMKAGSYCTALRETFPRGTHCPFRKTYPDSVSIGGREITQEEQAERRAAREQRKKEEEEANERDFWESFHYCAEH